ncbi:FMO5 monooxygenase, partial [Centropus unirufus]|nr:FMO5 monooxygenase [Centropus unirufus]
GIENFKGRYLHSRDYKDARDFTDKRVVVIGIGNSGSDLAVEISQTAKQVFLSTRRGAWVLNRVGDQGYPMDTVFTTRMKTFLKDLLSPSMVNSYVEKQLTARFDHSHYGLKPKHRVFDQHPTVNDDLPNRIISGRVLVKPNIQKFTNTSVIFDDGTKEDIDVVVFATGYSFSFPFLEGYVKVVENQIPLYKFMYVKSQRHTIQVDYIPYMDELACQIGVKPNLLNLFLTDPRLALEVFFGACTPYQYRLQGPGRWAGAREAILTQRQRIIK